jgi:tRNA-splicing ligase RtcB (3'-phosphate/5'-hydroxy nucleic acid ligase)
VAKRKKKSSSTAAALLQREAWLWELEKTANMRVPGLVVASEVLLRAMEGPVFTQLANVAALPGVVQAAWAMPDAHSGYGFPIGGVAAFDPHQGGVVSAGGVGFDIACGVRTLLTNLYAPQIRERQKELADTLFSHVPAGLGRSGDLHLSPKEMGAMLRRGARWAVDAGFGETRDLERCEESGAMHGADPDMVSEQAKKRQEDQVGTLGSGNHYLEVQEVVRIFDDKTAQAFGISLGGCVVSIHCGSRGLGHQIGTDYLKRMLDQAPRHGLNLPDKELACAPLDSTLGREYLGAMRAGINCALANRQVLTHLTRLAFAAVFPEALLSLLYDVSHNTCKEEMHLVNGKKRRLFVHRKGATRAFGPGHPDLPPEFRRTGQPVLVGGSMGAHSYILAGMVTEDSADRAFASANHGAGRGMSRSQAKKQYQGRDVLLELQGQGILLRTASLRGVAEEAPGAYKDVEEVVQTAQDAGLARMVAALSPLICVKG